MTAPIRTLGLMAGASAFLFGCVNVKTEPIRIEPIYIEITVNHRVQEELDKYFAANDAVDETMNYMPLDAGGPGNE